jgi:hypothetical protein
MSSNPNPDPSSLTIQKIRRTRTHIFIAYTHGNEDQTLKSRENPLPSFNEALDALTSLVCVICALPPAYVDKMTVGGITLAGTIDAQLITIIAKKDVPESNRPFNIATPLRLLFAPEPVEGTTLEPGPKAIPLPKHAVALIDHLIAEAKKYVAGERAQGLINFDAGAAGDGEDEEKP